MEIVLQRKKGKLPIRTPGEVRVNGVFFGYSVEDQVREILGRPVKEWKVPKQTAIPAGRYPLALEDSPHFGPGTISVHGVDGFDLIRFHAGHDQNDTEGCPLGGYALDDDDCIVPGLSRPMIANLKVNIREALARGELVFITVYNPA